MPWDGSGVFSRTNGTNTGATTWATDRDAGTDILASRHDTHDQDLADGIAACLTKNNESKPTADFKPNSDNAYALGSATARWTNAFLSTGLKLVGASFTTTVAFTAPTANRTITLPDATGTVALTANKLSAFAATTSAELAGVISDETGSGALVFATSPTFVTPVLDAATGTSLLLGTTTSHLRLGEVLEVAASGTDFGGANFTTWSASNRSAILDFSRSKSNAIGTYTDVASGDALGNIIFNGAASGAFRDAAQITSSVDGAVSGTTVPGRLEFYTTATGGVMTERLRITSDGRLYGTALHNNAGAVTGTTNQYIASGTYTPTFTSVTNCSSTVGNGVSDFHWIRVGNVVHVSGQCYTTTGGAGAVAFAISLPIASNLTSTGELTGTCTYDVASGTPLPGYIIGDATNDRASVNFKAGGIVTAGQAVVAFSYTVL